MNLDLEKIWSEVKGYLSKEMKGPSFQTWIRPSKLVELNECKALVAVRNEFNRNFLNQAYIGKIADAFEKALRRKVEVEIIVKSDLSFEEFIPSIAFLEDQKSKEPQKQRLENTSYLDHTFRYKSNLNPTYTFESFVVGPSNQFCHAACLAISESRNEQYNPLFIYGGVGLGKTHLAHAVANYTLEQDQKKQVLYITSESFTNELINSIRSNSMNNFREKYRKIDLLMIDDVQFLAGKEATQEEFFHTFNELRENGKQIIVTSDRPPSSLASIADRLRNRFEGGLIADIQAPDLEMRIAILMLKALQLKVTLPIDVAEYIATVFSASIRELEGALKRVYAYLSFTQEEVNLRNVKRVLFSEQASSGNPSPEQVLKTVANFYNIRYEDLISPKRSSDLTLPRYVGVYLLHEAYSLSFPRIGALLSNRTHSAAIYAYQQIKNKLKSDSAFSEEVNSLKGLVERRR